MKRKENNETEKHRVMLTVSGIGERVTWDEMTTRTRRHCQVPLSGTIKKSIKCRHDAGHIGLKCSETGDGWERRCQLSENGRRSRR